MGEEVLYDMVIVGSGPAGLSAALYAGRARLNTVILERAIIGGELMNRDMIENLPGYPEGIYGPDLASRLVKQVKNLGVKFEIAEVTGIETDGLCRIIETTEGRYWGKTILLACGAHHKTLGIPGEDRFANRGVFYCATCDGPAYAERKVAVVGGGDSGLTEALFLSKIGAKVIIMERLPHLPAQRVLQERVRLDPNVIEIRCNTEVEAIYGDEWVKAVEVLDVKTGRKEVLEVDGILIRIGLEPNTEPFKGKIDLDNLGRIRVDQRMETSMKGVFAAGDIRSGSAGQIVTAMGDGATAAIEIQRTLQSTSRF